MAINRPATDDFLNSLSVNELRLLCHHRLNKKLNDGTRPVVPEVALHYQREAAKRLAYIYSTGFNGTTPDKWHASKYAKLYRRLASNVALAYAKELELNPIRSENVYLFHVRVITHTRLLLGRIKRVATESGRPIMRHPLFSFLGLAAIASLLTDIIIILKTTFDPTLTPAEEDSKVLRTHYFKRTWERFKSVVLKDGRPYRLINDFIWSVVNGTAAALVLAGAPSALLIGAILNSIGFVLDVGHEAFWLSWEFKKHNPLIDKLKSRAAETPEESAGLNYIAKAVDTHKKKEVNKRLWTVACVFGVAVGMLLFYTFANFAAITLPAATIAGGVIALVCGSVLFGPGRALYDIYYPALKEWWHKLNKTKKPIPSSAHGYDTKKMLDHLKTTIKILPVTEPPPEMTRTSSVTHLVAEATHDEQPTAKAEGDQPPATPGETVVPLVFPQPLKPNHIQFPINSQPGIPFPRRDTMRHRPSPKIELVLTRPRATSSPARLSPKSFTMAS